MYVLVVSFTSVRMLALEMRDECSAAADAGAGPSGGAIFASSDASSTSCCVGGTTRSSPSAQFFATLPPAVPSENGT